MKKVFIVFHTDIWLSHSSFRTIGVASTFNKAIEMAQEDDDAVSDVISQDGHIVINSVILNSRDSDSQVFTTQDDDNKETIIKKRVDCLIENFGRKVMYNESESFVELIMDDHKCIEWNGKQFYIPENSILYNREDNELVSFLEDNCHV